MSLGEVEACAKLLESRHVARVRAVGFGSIFNWRVKSNISRPLKGVLYLKIDPDTMTLDMGEANKKLRITMMVYINYLGSLTVVVLHQGRQRTDMTML